jgi:osmoprotectant transport system ATP-binding protein
MLRLSNVTKHFGSVRAVGPIDLEAETGRTTVLIGPSGCGKSTVLRLMIGLARPDQGDIAFDGTPLTPANAPALRQRMGYVIQGGGLFPHLTAGENITLMARHLKRGTTEMADRVVALCRLTHFPEEALERFPGQLSGGQCQRVALMRALMLDPDVLLMDEPLGALDPIIRHDLQSELRDIFRTLNKTVVMVTHVMAEAGYFGDTLVLLRDGVIIQSGSVYSFVEAPADDFVRRFIFAQRSIDDILDEAGS